VNLYRKVWLAYRDGMSERAAARYSWFSRASAKRPEGLRQARCLLGNFYGNISNEIKLY
jgi:hypothetical protein